MMARTQRLLIFSTSLALFMMPKVFSSDPSCQTSASNCEVSDDDVSCTTYSGWYNFDAVTSDCRSLDCDDQYSCSGQSIFDSEKVKCGIAGCWSTSFSNIENLRCIGENACRSAYISDVPAGGRILCNSDSDGGVGLTCSGAEITSTNPFTLTCQSTGDRSSCQSGVVTNPGGSVFCHGQSSTNPACHELPITKTVGCVICGNKDGACGDVTIEDDEQNILIEVPDNKVWVHKRCKENDVIRYLNKLHPDEDTACEDSNNNGDCDVVEAYCANNLDDDNCVEEFKLESEGSWSKEERIQAAMDLDPEAFSSSNTTTNDDDDDNDKVGPESWLVGTVVIVVLLAVMIGVLGFTRPQWSLCKKAFGGESSQEDEEQGQKNDTTHESSGKEDSGNDDNDIIEEDV